MTLEKRKIGILEKILDQAIDRKYELEVGIEIKELMLLSNPTHEHAPKLEKIIAEERFMLENQNQAIEIMNRKLEEAKK